MGTHRAPEPVKLAGRSELIIWLNKTMSCTIEKIEQCCNGAIYVQLMDLVHPGSVPLAKVKFNASLEYEYLHNYKLLQSIFVKLGIDKHIDVQGLTKGRYQDNHEFLQWMRKYVDSHVTREPTAYDATKRRVMAVIQNIITNNGNAHLTLGSVTNALPKWAHDGLSVRLMKECLAQVKSACSPRGGSASHSASDGKIGSVSVAVAGNESKLRKVSDANSLKSKSSDSLTRASTHDNRTEKATKEASNVSVEAPEACSSQMEADLLAEEKRVNAELESLLSRTKLHNEVLKQEKEKQDREISALKEEIERQKELVETMKKKLGQTQAEKQVSKMSKEFYYNKLRKIEVMCQKNENGSLEVSALLEVLYATDSVQ